MTRNKTEGWAEASWNKSQIAETAQTSKWKCRKWGSRLSPCHDNGKMQVQVVDQTTHPLKWHSFVGLDRRISSSPPETTIEDINRLEEDPSQTITLANLILRKDVLRLFRRYPHTHTHTAMAQQQSRLSRPRSPLHQAGAVQGTTPPKRFGTAPWHLHPWIQTPKTKHHNKLSATMPVAKLQMTSKKTLLPILNF